MEKLGKVKWCLLGSLIVILMLAVSSVFIPDRLTQAVKLLANNNPASILRASLEQERI